MQALFFAYSSRRCDVLAGFLYGFAKTPFRWVQLMVSSEVRNGIARPKPNLFLTFFRPWKGQRAAKASGFGVTGEFKAHQARAVKHNCNFLCVNRVGELRELGVANVWPRAAYCTIHPAAWARR